MDLIESSRPKIRKFNRNWDFMSFVSKNIDVVPNLGLIQSGIQARVYLKGDDGWRVY